MSKRGENIYKRKDGRWEGRYIKRYVQKDGRVKPFFGYVYAKSYREVREKLLQKKAEQMLEIKETLQRIRTEAAFVSDDRKEREGKPCRTKRKIFLKN